MERVIKNSPSKYDSTERVLLIDADSIIYMCIHFTEESLQFFGSDELLREEVKYRIRNKVQEIQSSVDLFFNIKETFLFIGGGNNFRYKLYPQYKCKRPEKPKFFDDAKECLLELGAISAVGCEVDDFIFEANEIAHGNTVIASIDKDLSYWIPNAIIYHYKGNTEVMGEWKIANEREARLARATQCVIGDPTDGIPGAKGVGQVWCNKNLKLGMTDYQYTKAVFKAFLKSTKNDVESAKSQLKLTFKLLRLWRQNEIKALNL